MENKEAEKKIPTGSPGENLRDKSESKTSKAEHPDKSVRCQLSWTYSSPSYTPYPGRKPLLNA